MSTSGPLDPKNRGEYIRGLEEALRYVSHMIPADAGHIVAAKIRIEEEKLHWETMNGQFWPPSQLPMASFDVGNGRITEGDMVRTVNDPYLGPRSDVIVNVLKIFQDGDVAVQFMDGYKSVFKWRYLVPLRA